MLFKILKTPRCIDVMHTVACWWVTGGSRLPEKQEITFTSITHSAWLLHGAHMGFRGSISHPLYGYIHVYTVYLVFFEIW